MAVVDTKWVKTSRCDTENEANQGAAGGQRLSSYVQSRCGIDLLYDGRCRTGSHSPGQKADRPRYAADINDPDMPARKNM